MAINIPTNQIDGFLNNLPLMLTGGDPAGFVHSLSLGLATITQDQTDGHVENISVNGLVTGAGIDFSDDPNQRLGSPAQLAGDAVVVSPFDELSGRNISGINITGPADLDAVYGDNPGGSTDTGLNLAEGLLTAGLLEGYGDRAPHNLSIDAPLQTVDALWDATAEGPPDSQWELGQILEAQSNAGPGHSGNLDSLMLNGLLEGGVLFGEHTIGPFALGNEDDPLHGVLLNNAAAGTIESLTLGSGADGLDGIAAVSGILDAVGLDLLG